MGLADMPLGEGHFFARRPRPSSIVDSCDVRIICQANPNVHVLASRDQVHELTFLLVVDCDERRAQRLAVRLSVPPTTVGVIEIAIALHGSIRVNLGRAFVRNTVVGTRPQPAGRFEVIVLRAERRWFSLDSLVVATAHAEGVRLLVGKIAI